MPAGARFGIHSSATRQNVAHFGACSTPGMPAGARFGIDSGAARQNVARFLPADGWGIRDAPQHGHHDYSWNRF